jgi:hypothetical protein
MSHRHQALIDRGVVTALPDGRLRLTGSAWRTMTAHKTLHFVGFKDDRWHNAVKIFGMPDFIHRRWDYRAFCECCPGDVVVFADGDEHSPIYPYAYDDSAFF